MLPWAGGLSGFVFDYSLIAFRGAGALAGFEPNSSPRTITVIAASNPSSAVGFSNLRFVMFVCAFMTSKFAIQIVGSNDNYHHISATQQSRLRRAETIPSNE